MTRVSRWPGARCCRRPGSPLRAIGGLGFAATLLAAANVRLESAYDTDALGTALMKPERHYP